MGERTNLIIDLEGKVDELEAELTRRGVDETTLRNWRIAAGALGAATCALISALVGVLL